MTGTKVSEFYACLQFYISGPMNTNRNIILSELIYKKNASQLKTLHAAV